MTTNDEINTTESNSKKDCLKRQIKRRFRLWSLSSTSHGLPRIVESNKIYLKLMWLVFLLASIVLSSFVIIQNVNEFLQYDVFTKIRVVPQNEIKFPLITICTLKPFQSFSAAAYINDFLDTGDNFTLNKYFESNQEANSNITVDFQDAEWLFYITNHPSFNKTLRKSFVQMNENNIDCKYKHLSCEPNDFVPFYDPSLGSCYQFNSGRTPNGSQVPIKMMSRENEGVELILFLGPSDEHFYYTFENMFSGAVIYINDHDYFPVRQQGIHIKTGTSAFIRLNRIQWETMPYPYSNCIEADKVDTLLSRELKKLGINYTRRNCLAICEQKSIYDTYGCYSLYLPPVFNATPCTRNRHTVFDLSECFDDCPHECKSADLDISISYSDFPSYNSYSNLLRTNEKVFQEMYQTENITYDMVKNSYCYLYIFYDQIRSTQITESPSMTLVDLIGNIGGTLGLFIGVSLLSFVEIIELFIDIVAIFLNRNFK